MDKEGFHQYVQNQREVFLQFVLADLEDTGYTNVTTDINAQDSTTFLYIFRDPNGTLLHHCKTIEDVFDLEEMGYIPV